MRIHRLSHTESGRCFSTRYFARDDQALAEAEGLVRIVEHLHTPLKLGKNEVDGMVIWSDRWPGPTVEIRLEEGRLEL